MPVQKEPALTIDAVHAFVGDQSFVRAQEYAAQGYIFDCSHSQDKSGRHSIRAQSGGNSGGPYWVGILIHKQQIVSAKCSCPVGVESAGHCKHVAAALLHWLEQPNEFVEVEDLSTVLDRLSKSELTKLIENLLTLAPHLVRQVVGEKSRSRQAASNANTTQEPNPKPSQVQVEALLNSSRLWSHRDIHSVDGELRRVVDKAVTRADNGDLFGAAEIYIGMLHALMPILHQFDENWSYPLVHIRQCVVGLQDCLENAEASSKLRSAILDTLIFTIRIDISELGGLGASEGVVDILVNSATPEERLAIAQTLRADIDQANIKTKGEARQFRSQWSQEKIGLIVLKLLDNQLDDTAYLTLCRDAHLLEPAIRLMLTRGRIDEAEKLTVTASDYELVGLANTFKAASHADSAVKLLLGRAKTSADSRLAEWLRGHFAEANQVAEACEWAKRVLELHPSIEDYRHLKTLWPEPSTWPRERESVLTIIKATRWESVFVDILLEEQLYEEAIEFVEAPKSNRSGYRVAQAVEATRPEDAIRLYAPVIAAHIAERKRQAYAEAADLLVRMHTLYRRCQRESEWAIYLAQIQETARQLPALSQEIAKRAIEL